MKHNKWWKNCWLYRRYYAIQNRFQRFFGVCGRKLIEPNFFKWFLIGFVIFAIWFYQDRVTYFGNIRNYHSIQNEKEKFDVLIEINKTIVSIFGTFASIIGTFATVVGGIFLYLNFNLANKNFQLAMKKNATDKNLANKNFQLAIEKNATDKKLTELKLASERFSKATEQLASDKLPARLGAIYGLENIAREHEEYHWIVVEVISAFIRESKSGDTISVDCQSALTVIGRRNINLDKDRVINLSGANLRGAFFDENANFSKVYFV